MKIWSIRTKKIFYNEWMKTEKTGTHFCLLNSFFVKSNQNEMIFFFWFFDGEKKQVTSQDSLSARCIIIYHHQQRQKKRISLSVFKNHNFFSFLKNDQLRWEKFSIQIDKWKVFFYWLEEEKNFSKKAATMEMFLERIFPEKKTSK